MKEELEKVLKEKSDNELRELLKELVEYDDFYDAIEERFDVWQLSRYELLRFIDNYTDNEIESVLRGE